MNDKSVDNSMGSETSKHNNVLKQLFMWLTLLVLMPIIFFGLLELSLRVAGYGYSTSYFKESNIGGESYLVPNTTFTYRFFPPALARRPMELRMLEEKPPATYRIFLFGESAAYGDPHPSYGIGRQIQILLQERFPGTQFEIVSTAMTAINSHAILPIAEEVAELDGDLWLIYMGNNEMIGAFGPGTVFGLKALPLDLIRSILALKSTRTGQLLDNLIRELRSSDNAPPDSATPENTAPEKWGGINMFSKNLGYSDSGRLTAYKNFEGNLHDILNVAVDANVPVVLSTVASNLKHTAPFNSVHSTTLSDEQRKTWNQHYQKGAGLEASNQCDGALDQYSLAAEIDSNYADLHFRMGRCYLKAGYTDLAKNAYRKARDYDGLAVRADTRINTIIRNSAADFADDQVELVDTVKQLASGSPDGIPGRDLFYEHVHYTIDGNYRLALLLANQVANKLPAKITASDTGGWADAEFVANDFALSLWDKYRVWTDMTQRLSAPPHAGTLNFGVNRDYAAARAKQIVSQIDIKTTPVKDNETYTRAISKRPDDNWLHTHYAQYLYATGSRGQSIRELRIVRDLLPDLEWPHFFLGEYLAREKRYAEAARSFKRALEIRADFAMAQQGLDKVEELKR